MSEYKRVAKRADIPPGTAQVIEAGDIKIAIFNVEGAIHAVHNVCKHRGGPLGEGVLTGSTVRCPWHGWSYDVRTGRHLAEPVIRVSCFSVKLEGDDVLVEL
jgi:nitrite reductase/ring-hydroxylating ferredoxin subunit